MGARSRESENYFHRNLDALIDEAYGQNGTERAVFSVQKERLVGALSYARHMGDIDGAYYRIFSDMLTGLTCETVSGD